MGASESTPDEPSVEPPPVVELDNELKEWAWRQYSRTASDSMTKKDLGFKVIWDSVHFETRDVCYGEKQGPSPSQSTMVFKSDYTNNTMETQEHNFTTQRTTEATSTTALTNGFTRGVKNGITIPVPPEVTNVTSGFGNEVDVETENKNSVKHSMTWSANSLIRVPRSSRTVATLQINQETFNCSFTALVVFSGRVKIKISNMKTGAFLMTVENLIGQIVKDVFEEYGYSYNDSDPLSVHTDGRAVFWPVGGSLGFKYGVSQKVEVSHVGSHRK
ncbi:uncharacterized protein LOC124281277 [Haliotis rubra]|uniref:uncharacterized protein LOC124260933 n=1 Tax=Haliotis rubra TaxID=36100 RepID=UPI001EE5D504|nr:uncharacterized protein LOC124260933 [Haliotis rubra]XP_046573266.1 uncharacterized protein LOC124281277 [Haliotis rubra]